MATAALIALAVIAIVLLLRYVRPEARIQRLVQQALAHERAGELGNATQAVRRALEVASDRADLRILLARLHVVAGQAEAARPELAAAMGSRDVAIAVEAGFRLANLELGLGRAPQALQILADLEKRQDLGGVERTNLHFLAARVHMGIGRPADALREFEYVIATRADAVPPLLGSAEACEALGDRVEARRRAERALKMEPGNPFALTFLGTLSLEEGRRDEAKAILAALRRGGIL